MVNINVNVPIISFNVKSLHIPSKRESHLDKKRRPNYKLSIGNPRHRKIKSERIEKIPCNHPLVNSTSLLRDTFYQI